MIFNSKSHCKKILLSIIFPFILFSSFSVNIIIFLERYVNINVTLWIGSTSYCYPFLFLTNLVDTHLIQRHKQAFNSDMYAGVVGLLFDCYVCHVYSVLS